MYQLTNPSDLSSTTHTYNITDRVTAPSFPEFGDFGTIDSGLSVASIQIYADKNKNPQNDLEITYIN